MKARLSKNTLIGINIFFICMYITGIVIESVCQNEIVIIGVICQIISFIYTAIGYIVNIFIKINASDYSMPTYFFTDRKATINTVIEHLYNILYLKCKDQIIPIVCSEEEGSGKTELLLKIRQLLDCKSIAKSELDRDHYRMYLKIKRKIGYVYLINYGESKNVFNINELPYVIRKKNIVFIDNCPILSTDKFNEKTIVIFCQKDNSKLSDPNNKEIKLNKFGEKEIKEYYNRKFKRDLNELILQRIIKYSNGNISKVVSILDTQQSYETFCNNSEIIYDIEQYLREGDYQSAQQIIERMTSNEKNLIDKDPETFFRLKFIKADLLHLQNEYEEALNQFELLRLNNLNDDSKMQEIIEKISHIQKHLGNFGQAIAEAQVLNNDIKSQKCLSLNLLEYSVTENEHYLRAAEKNIHDIEKISTKYITSQKDSYDTYKAVVCIYHKKFNVAHRFIDQAISIYEKQDSRFLNNCYYIKAEIFRHEQKYSQACEYYQRCLNAYRFNNDIDVYSMAYTMLVYLNTVYNAKHEFEITYSLDELKKICAKRKMDYNKKILMKLDQLNTCKDNEIKQTIICYFDKFVFFIP